MASPKVPHVIKSQIHPKTEGHQGKFTLDEAFDYFNVPSDEEPSMCALNNERCVRAAAFLLHYCSQHGNDPMHGYIAHGLGHALEQCADNIAFNQKSQELRKAVRRG